MTEPDTHEILSALLDREPIDPDQLAALLERPEGRALLVDFVRLRSVLHADAGQEAGPPVPMLPGGRTVARTLLGLAAAALLVVSGALVGSRFAASDGDLPPEPTRVVKLVPGPAPRGAR